MTSCDQCPPEIPVGKTTRKSADKIAISSFLLVYMYIIAITAQLCLFNMDP